jgi:putative peptidoglycan binding protein
VGLSPITWAAGHGGGGFGGGGHFGGGGFQAGGFHTGGQVAGGVGTRGGGVGFGRARFSGDVPNFAGAGSRFSSFGKPSSRRPVYDGRPNGSVTYSADRITASNRQQNHFASGTSAGQGSRPPAARHSDQRLSNVRNHIVAQHDANWHGDWDRRHAYFDHGHFFVFIDGFWCGLDAGFYPWDYLPYYPNDYYPYDYYADVDPYDYNGPSNNIAPADSSTVQAVQTQLLEFGYYNGSIDGVFGPSTRDAVAKYQIANQLNVTGSLSPDTLQSLGLTQATAS